MNFKILDKNNNIIKNQKNRFSESTNGITLIALVVTIVVLLILAEVSINMITGKNEIINRASEAKEKTDQAQADELDILNDYETQINNYVGIDWGTVLANATKHPNQITSTSIGVGTDGKPVNMDLWEYTLMEDGNYGLNDEESLLAGATRTSSYKGKFINGRIEGTIPQFIKDETDENFVEVTDLSYLFFKNTDLEVPPEIPSTVINMRATFNSTSIVTVSKIPDGVTNMYGTFANCSKLSKAPILPNSITNMQGTFTGCSSLTEAPYIPNGVTNMQATFDACCSLKRSPIIPNTVTNMYGTFRNCTSLITASSIPSNVEIIIGTFEGCSNLQGELEINSSANGTQLGADFANRKDYNRCLLNAATEGKISLKLTGKCIMLQEIINEANNTNITLIH